MSTRAIIGFMSKTPTGLMATTRYLKYGGPSQIVPTLRGAKSLPAVKRLIAGGGNRAESYSSFKEIVSDVVVDLVYLFNNGQWYATWNDKNPNLVPLEKFVKDNGIEVEG